MPAPASAAPAAPAARPAGTAALHPGTHSQLWLPRSALTGCLRAAMSRSTLGVRLGSAQRLNHLPASPLCSLHCWIEGQAHLLPPGTPLPADADDAGRTRAPAALGAPVPRLLLVGPMTHPVTSWNPGPVHSFSLLLQPDALHRLTGLDVSAWVNRLGDARHALPADWLALTDALFHAPDDSQRMAQVEDFLSPRWAAARPALPIRAERYLDWAQSIALHAACSAPGRSLRQMERRIKQWTGLPLRQLRSVGRSEQAFLAAAQAADQGTAPRWSELADATGFSDQAHLCRETRRMTGFSPEELYRRILSEEGFWAYRLWR